MMELFDEDDEEFFRRSRQICEGKRFADDVRHGLSSSGPTSRQFTFPQGYFNQNGDVLEAIGAWPISAPSSLDQGMLAIDARHNEDCALRPSSPKMASSHLACLNLGSSLPANPGPELSALPGAWLPQSQPQSAAQMSQLPASWAAAPASAPSAAYIPAPAPSAVYVPAPAPAPSAAYMPAPAPAPSAAYMPAPAPAPSAAYMPAPGPGPAQVPNPSPPASMHASTSTVYAPPVPQLTAPARGGRWALGYPHKPSFGPHGGQQQQMVVAAGGAPPPPPLGATPALVGADLPASRSVVIGTVFQETYEQCQRQPQQLLLHHQHQGLQAQLPQQCTVAQPHQQQHHQQPRIQQPMQPMQQMQQPVQLRMQQQMQSMQEQQQMQQQQQQQQLEQRKLELQRHSQLQQHWQQQQQQTQLQPAHSTTWYLEAKPQLLQPLVCAHPRGDLPSRYPRLQPLEAQPAQVGQLPSQPKLQLQPDPLPLLPLPPPPPPPLPPQLLSSSHYDDVQEEDYLMAEILAAPWPSSKTVQDATAAAHAAAAALARTKLVTHNERANPQPKPSGAPQQVSMEAAAASAFAAPECGPNTPSQSPPPLPESWQGSRRVQAAPDDAPLKKLNEAVVEAAPAPARPRWISVHDQGAVPWKIKAELGGAEVKAEMRPLGQSAMALGSDHPRANLTLKQQTTLLYEHQLQLVVPQGDLRLGQLDMAASRKLAAGAAAAAAAAAASAGPVATDGADRGGTLLLHVPLAGGRTSSTVVVDDMHDDSMQDDLPPPPSLPLDVFMADDLAECDGEDSDCDSDVTMTAAGGPTTATTSTAAAAPAAATAAAATAVAAATTADPSPIGGSKAAEVQVTMELLRSMFHLPVADVSRTLGVSSTDLKRRCRALGIGRWPQRKLTSLDKLGGAVASDPHISEDERQKTLALVARNRDDIIRDPDTALDPWVAPKRQMHYKRKFVDRRGGGRRSYGKKKGG